MTYLSGGSSRYYFAKFHIVCQVGSSVNVALLFPYWRFHQVSTVFDIRKMMKKNLLFSFKNWSGWRLINEENLRFLKLWACRHRRTLIFQTTHLCCFFQMPTSNFQEWCYAHCCSLRVCRSKPGLGWGSNNFRLWLVRDAMGMPSRNN